MDLFGQIVWEEMLGDLMVATFLILLAASIAVACLMVTLPLIDLAFKKKVEFPPRPAQVETWRQDELTRAYLSGRPWLAMRSDFSRPDAVPLSPLPVVRMTRHAVAHRPFERITPLTVRSLVPQGSAGARPDPLSSDNKKVA
jgi:hypothetical protein